MTEWNDAYCPPSEHNEKLHGVLLRDRYGGADDGTYMYGQCCYCKRIVRGHRRERTPWQAERYLIEEEPV